MKTNKFNRQLSILIGVKRNRLILLLKQILCCLICVETYKSLGINECNFMLCINIVAYLKKLYSRITSKMESCWPGH